MRPPFAYYGGKIGMARRIVGLLPEHRVYLEPFAGSLAVLFAKAPATHEIVNDLDGVLVTFFRVLRDRAPELEAVCALTPHARAEYEAADVDAEGLDELEIARRFWVRVNQPGTILGRLRRFAPVAERLARVSIEQCDAAGLIERLATPDAVIYADPPYVAATRRSMDRSRHRDYRHEMTDQDHRQLAEVLAATPATVVLSGYPGDLYDELYGDWWHLDVPVTAHSSNAASTTRGSRVERIWSNRDLADGRLPWDQGGAA